MKLATLAALALPFAVPSLDAQTAVSVTQASSLFQPWLNTSGTMQIEPIADQQTGISSADFMGVASGTTGLTPTPSVNVPGAMVTAGTIGGVDHIVFRFRMVDKNGNKTYLGSTLSVGLSFPELTTGGRVTIYASVESSQQGNRFFFQSPGTGLNESPSTTTLDGGAFAGNPYSRSAPLTLTSSNWSYTPAASLPVPEQSYDRSGTSGTDANSFVTFAVRFSDIQAATRALTGSTTFTMNYTTEMAFIAFTASQYNSINQDIHGTATQASNTLTTTWSAMGAFTDYVTAAGTRRPIPEASTVVQVGLLMATGVVAAYRRRRLAATAKTA
jgi:hypothetical protein